MTTIWFVYFQGLRPRPQKPEETGLGNPRVAAIAYLKGRGGAKGRGGISMEAVAQRYKISAGRSGVSYWVQRFREDGFDDWGDVDVDLAVEDKRRTRGPPEKFDVGGLTTWEVYSQAYVWAGVEARKGSLSTRTLAEHVRHRFGVEMSHTTVRRSRDNLGNAPSRRGATSYIPEELSEKVVDFVVECERQKLPVFKGLVIANMNNIIRGTPVASKFKRGEVSDGWYYRWLETYGERLKTHNIDPLEMDRQRWESSSNMAKYYDVLHNACVGAGIAEENPDYNPEVEGSESCFLTAPERMASADESSFTLDMTDAKKDRRNRVVGSAPGASNKKARRDAPEVIVNKSSERWTSIGGSYANGESLPPHHIFQGLSYEYGWGADGPKSTLGRPGTCHCNATGGATESDNSLVRFLEWNVLPHMSPPVSPENKMVLILDGHGSHMTLEVLKFCREKGIAIVLRPPHTTHRTQGEDTHNFREVKPAFRHKKYHIFARKMKNSQGRLTMYDAMACLKEPWEKGFTREMNTSAWKAIGIRPFTRSVYWDMRKKEAKRQDKGQHAEGTTDFSHVTVESMVDNSFPPLEPEDPKVTATRGIRLNSGMMFARGAATDDVNYAAALEASEAKQAKVDAAAKRQEARRERHAEVREANLADEKIAMERLAAGEDLQNLQCKYLHAILAVRRINPGKTKSAMVEQAQKLQDTGALAYTQTNTDSTPATSTRKRARPPPPNPDPESDSEPSDSDSEESSLGLAPDEFIPHRILDACRDGRTFGYLVQWRGYPESEATWEPTRTLIRSMSLITLFQKPLKDAGQWPPQKLWDQVGSHH